MLSVGLADKDISFTAVRYCSWLVSVLPGIARLVLGLVVRSVSASLDFSAKKLPYSSFASTIVASMMPKAFIELARLVVLAVVALMLELALRIAAISTALLIAPVIELAAGMLALSILATTIAALIVALAVIGLCILVLATVLALRLLDPAMAALRLVDTLSAPFMVLTPLLIATNVRTGISSAIIELIPAIVEARATLLTILALVFDVVAIVAAIV